MDIKYLADVQWVRDLEFVFKYGHAVSPRGMRVYEVLAYTSMVSMDAPIIFNSQRALGYKFMAAEAAWIIGGQDDVASIAPYSKEISKFSDDGETFFGAYGPRIQSQLEYAISALVKDQDSRQALVTVWRPNPRPSKDIPCTVALQWLIRQGRLHCVATMRSSDLWLGHPYDIFNFSALSFYVMLYLNKHYASRDADKIKLGELHLTAGSKHVYERNVEGVSKIIGTYNRVGFITSHVKSPFIESKYDSPDDFVTALWDAANSESGAISLVE